MLLLGLALGALHLLDALDDMVCGLLVRLLSHEFLDVQHRLLTGGVLVVAHRHIVVSGARVERGLHIDVLVWGRRVLDEGVA